MTKLRDRSAAGPRAAGAKRNGHEADLREAEALPPLTVAADSNGQSIDDRNGHERAAAPVAFQRKPTERIRKLALRQLERLVSLEPKVLRDESPEAVHDLRVASRRLQSLLDFLYPVPQSPQIRKSRRRLKEARSVLGELRNQDVLLARMDRMLARKRAAHREAWEGAREYVSELRPETAKKAQRRLTRLNLAHVYVRLRDELSGPNKSMKSREVSPESAGNAASPDAGGSAQPRSLPRSDAETAARFAQRLNDLFKLFEEMAGKLKREPEALHPLRLATKRLRYHVEVAMPLQISGSGEALRWLRELQRKFGDWHDLEVLDSTLINMLARRKFLRTQLPLAMKVEKLILSLRESKSRQCRRYVRRAMQSAQHGRLAAWVSQFAVPPRTG